MLQKLPVVTQMKSQHPRPLPTSMTSTPVSPPAQSSSHTGFVFMSSPFTSLPPLCCFTCCSCLECSSSCEQHLLRGPLGVFSLNVSLLVAHHFFSAPCMGWVTVGCPEGD